MAPPQNGSVNATGEVNINVEGNGVSDKVGAQGVRLAYSNANFAKDVNVIATATADDAIAHGLNILADSSMVASNAVFNGDVDLTVNSAHIAYILFFEGFLYLSSPIFPVLTNNLAISIAV